MVFGNLLRESFIHITLRSLSSLSFLHHNQPRRCIQLQLQNRVQPLHSTNRYQDSEYRHLTIVLSILGITQAHYATLEDLPVELMDMIMKIKGANDAPLLDVNDLTSLRQPSRQINALSLRTLSRRFFTMRKHMRSRASLECLVGIARSPALSPYVQTVAIGPERVNSRVQATTPHSKDPAVRDGWKEGNEVAWDALVREQRESDASNAADSMMKEAFELFKNLKLVRLDSYATKDRLKKY
jgi:hypothetical protein